MRSTGPHPSAEWRFVLVVEMESNLWYNKRGHSKINPPEGQLRGATIII